MSDNGADPIRPQPHQPASGGAGRQAGDGTRGDERAGYTPPALPPVRASLLHVVIPVTAAWLVAAVVLLFSLDNVRADGHLIWLWTSLAGGLLGGVGLSIYGWQRRAARRGGRSAQRTALDT